MKKSFGYVLAVIVLSVVAVTGFLLGVYFQKNNVYGQVMNTCLGGNCPTAGYSDTNRIIEIMSDAEKELLSLNDQALYEVVARDQDGIVTSYRIFDSREKGPIALEWMTDAEKMARNLSLDEKIQVLERNEVNETMAYKIIKDDSDILTSY